MKRPLAAILLCLGLVAATYARKHSHHNWGGTKREFDYYLLALSWAPNYCASHPGDHSRECNSRAAFVLHGLWPQSESGAPPMDCGQSSAPSSATVDHMLAFMPSRGLIRHEWSRHGTCSGLSPDAYFQTVEEAFTAIRVPETYRSLSHEAQVKVGDLEQSFAAENRAPQAAFRTSCHDGALVGIEVCLDKDLKYRGCTRSARECPDQQVRVQSP